jgi:hypothetical protein
MHTVKAQILLDISNDYIDHRSKRDNSWFGYSDGEFWGATPFAVSYLFRGQTSYYSPMLPSIARGLQATDIVNIWESPFTDQAKIILRFAQSWWFSRELNLHPISTHASNLKLDLDPIALAQHYGIPTGYLDLTDDFNVSAFFATCRLTKYGWEPIDKGVGVIYRAALMSLNTPIGYYTPLGPQPLPRPTEQCAWVAELPFCHSFENWPNVSILQFHHNKQVGEHFLKMFNGGEGLFPPDPLAEVANEILTCDEIPSIFIELAFESLSSDPYGIKIEHMQILQKEIAKQTSIVSDKKLLTNQQVSTLLNDEAWRKKMLADIKVRWRAIRRIPIARSSY